MSGRHSRSTGVAVVIPARDEAATIGPIVRKSLLEAEAVIVSDDGSRDKTAAVAARAGAIVVSANRRLGYGAAITAALRTARAQGLSPLVTLDADGAHDPGELLKVLSKHQRAGHDLTIGSRFAGNTDVTIPSSKRWANYFAAAIVNRVLGTRLEDVACGFRVLSGRLVDAILLSAPSVGFGLAYEFIRVAVGQGYTIGSAPTSVHYDAMSLQCTGRRELLDLLDFCIANASASTRRSLLRMHDHVWRKHVIACSFGQRTIVLQPVPNRSAYVFQLQDPVFQTRAVPTFDFSQEGSRSR